MKSQDINKGGSGGRWLGDRDSNPDKQSQNLLSYH